MELSGISDIGNIGWHQQADYGTEIEFIEP
jgi:hypothetical protein